MLRSHTGLVTPHRTVPTQNISAVTESPIAQLQRKESSSCCFLEPSVAKAVALRRSIQIRDHRPGRAQEVAPGLGSSGSEGISSRATGRASLSSGHSSNGLAQGAGTREWSGLSAGGLLGVPDSPRWRVWQTAAKPGYRARGHFPGCPRPMDNSGQRVSTLPDKCYKYGEVRRVEP